MGEVVGKDAFLKTVEQLKKGKVRQFPVIEPYCQYQTAWEEEKFTIAQANAPVDDNGRFLGEDVSARQSGNFKMVPRDQVDYIDVSPKQLVSLSAALIPFLEHDDANRALMGSNMQRQAVPLLRPEAPLVGTGIEYLVAKGSGDVVTCRRPGVVEFVDAERILIRVDEKEKSKEHEVGTDLYQMTKFLRTNQNTCINHRPIVRKGDPVEKGQILADSSCTDRGELALGRNVLCAFMPWRGYNFEDAIIVSERLIKKDIFSSIHIVEETIEARDTKLGPEEITRDIPNVPENLLRNLDENGIVRIGAYVKSGDILVGKVAPKGETQLSPEEKLLKAIFGEKALDVKDASLYCSPGIEGTVIDVRIFSRRGSEKGPRAKVIEKEEIAKMKRNLEDEISILDGEKARRIRNYLKGEVLDRDQKVSGQALEKGTKLTDRVLETIDARGLRQAEARGERGAGPQDQGHRQEGAAADRRPPRRVQGKGRRLEERRRAVSGSHPGHQGLHRHEAQAVRRRQGLRTAREQGHRRQDRARGGHAPAARRHAGRDRPQPPGRSFPHERRADPGDPSRLGGQRAQPLGRHAGLRRHHRERDQGAPEKGRPAGIAARRSCSTAWAASRWSRK